MGHHRPVPLTPTAAITAKLMDTRAEFRKTFEDNLGVEISDSLEKGVYFLAPDNITAEDSLYKQIQSALKEVVDSDPELAAKIKSGEEELETLETHEKVTALLPPPIEYANTGDAQESTS
ncbi:20193_t:CDS:2 [Dentiscutata erythropus]|uniref:20193_t:CDS:1 n=1 Tax=Dentiscutata erythropus TaxID=1348616 RepID=A0A9N9DKS1_9GLOM|nr:20193_t:CDS:2 [Dentiscutata erythropus]